jgi:nitrogen-specific signal transduction histidine kinase
MQTSALAHEIRRPRYPGIIGAAQIEYMLAQQIRAVTATHD